MGFLKDFRDFAVKGNVIDLAVGVIIGGAFGKIVSSLVNDIFMPVIGLITGKGFRDMKLVLKEATKDAAGADIAEVSMNYGMFIQNTIDFIIIALVIFFMIRMLNSMKKAEPAPAPAPPPGPSKEEILLGEIRDLLKNRS
ncbi:MAG: large-conductance mechanosensitive channel protein MscL [Cytophagales bacterium]|nr:MAG: large-conductance mechanosensitive channel protein MscL [Cytophagales bacterium]TAF59765.1 MAG: large-conductance mechanosensitive channel protein MscL [Cytophagales bacterium]